MSPPRSGISPRTETATRVDDQVARNRSPAADDPYDDESREAELNRVFRQFRRVLEEFDGFDESVKQQVAANGGIANLLIESSAKEIEDFDEKARSVRYNEFRAGHNLDCENAYSKARMFRLIEELQKAFGTAADDRVRLLRQDYARRRASFESFRADQAAKIARRQSKLIKKERTPEGGDSQSAPKNKSGSLLPPQCPGMRRMTVTEAAGHIGICAKQLTKWIRGEEGTIKCEHVSGRLYDFDAEELGAKKAAAAARKARAERRKTAKAAKEPPQR